jgi:hypothetical protein
MAGAEPNDDVGLVLWSLKRHSGAAASTKVIAAALPEQISTARTRELLEKAEDRDLVRELVPDWWEITEAGRVFPSGQS